MNSIGNIGLWITGTLVPGGIFMPALPVELAAGACFREETIETVLRFIGHARTRGRGFHRMRRHGRFDRLR